VDLRIHFEKHRRWVFGFLLIAVITSVVKDVILYGRFADPANLAFHAIFMVSCISAILVRAARFHEFMAIVSAIAMGAYVATLFAHFSNSATLSGFVHPTICFKPTAAAAA